jgi:D-alanine-D-alanine ligase-like ATP-grasp enzyme
VLPFIDYVIDLRHSGKDAKLEKLLHDFNIKSILKYNDEESNIRKIMHQMDIDTPNHITIKKDVDNIIDAIHDVWRKIHLPVIVKSENKNTTELKTHDVRELYNHVLYIHKKGHHALIDQAVPGKEYTLVTINNFRGQKIYASPLKEIITIKMKRRLYFAHSLSDIQKKEIFEKAIKAHSILDSKILEQNFVYGKQGPVLISVNSKPTYKNDSDLRTHFKDSGITFADIILSEKVK